MFLRKLRKLTGSPLYLALLALFFGGLWLWHPIQSSADAAGAVDAGRAREFRWFAPLLDYGAGERTALLGVLVIACAGLAYAAFLVRQVKEADQGTPRMQEVASAIREGANAYLSAQFRKIGPLIVLITLVLYLTKMHEPAFAFGRASAFLVGSLFSWTVGFVGMRMATIGNLRVAAAAQHSYGKAMRLGYRTGTITGMLTDGLGLLGGTLIFLIYGEQAYEVLLGFGFGGTLLALFMRVGGGIYTKAADVGADLVGKIEQAIPEDDPRNAATIADNVGDNVGDCAGMAADVFQSYEVTMVAAMILGFASFGHKGVIFPLLVRGIGVLGSMISTYTVKARPGQASDAALRSVHRGFWTGSAISVAGFFILGLVYLHFDAAYLNAYSKAAAGFPNGNPADLPVWANFGWAGLDMRPALTCLVGVLLAIALNKVTSFFTHTSYHPVKSLAEACRSGHAMNIIQGFAIGYESAVAATMVIAVGIVLSVLCYWDMSGVFIAYGIAMTGIGMLTLTGNTIAMDVFGPVADNANGIGEMGYDRAAMEREQPGSYHAARQVLADLDAVGNTTKAETKGIAIGAAVIAAISLFASFIAVIAVGSEDRVGQMHQGQYSFVAGQLTVASPMVLIGFLIGGAVPFLFSAMLLRAVVRAAQLIVRECRKQFADAEILAGTKKPEYGRVVDICTTAAQRELLGPGILAVFTPIFVGFLLGPFAMGGFLAGMILVGQLLAVFMANAGGAWDNAKKMIEDGLHGGKGSETHKASVTGDTVGDPLKDTAGPAISPLVKVVTMVSLLSLTFVLANNTVGVNPKTASDIPAEWVLKGPTHWTTGLVVVAVSLFLILWAVRQSVRSNAAADDEKPPQSPENSKPAV